MTRGPFSPGTLILGGGGVLLSLFLLVGWLLPQSWEAAASAHIAAPASAVYPLLDSPEGWRRWTPWPESGVERSGPTRGTGATLSWDDPELGSGSFAIVGGAEPSSIEYAVRVDDGAMRTDGTLSLTPEAGGVRVDWREEGDLGWNPLMGYWALSLSRAQSEELAKGLERLRTLVADASAAGQPAVTSPPAPGP
ncbi:MAG: SRPBCC family protein [Gemmatimonadales bacterium]